MNVARNIAQAMHKAHLRYQRDKLGPEINFRRGTIADMPKPVYHPTGYYRLNCSHDKPMWIKCERCKRNSSEASQNFMKLMSGKL